MLCSRAPTLKIKCSVYFPQSKWFKLATNFFLLRCPQRCHSIFLLHETHLFCLLSQHPPVSTLTSPPCAPSFMPPLSVCPLVPSTPPLLAVCYSCWSNLENVPNPLSVLLPQRNTKWIRQDYRLPLPPPPPSRLPLPPLLLLRAVTLSSSSHFPCLSTCMSIFLWTFLFSSAGLKPSPSPDDKLVPMFPRWQMLSQTQCIMGQKVLLIKLWPLANKNRKNPDITQMKSTRHPHVQLVQGNTDAAASHCSISFYFLLSR